MRVFQVCGDKGIPPDGTKGASVHLRAVAEALVARDHDVTMFTSRAPGDRRALPCDWRPMRSARSIVTEALHRAPPDVVYERYSLGHLAGLESARDIQRPLVLEVNSPLVLEAALHRPDSLNIKDADAEVILLRSADLVVAVSHTLQAYIESIRRNGPTVVIPNGCKPDLFPVPAPLDGADGDVIVFLGNPKPWHGATRLPALIADLRRRGRDARLLVLGGGRGAGELEEQASAHGVLGWVEMAGALSHEDATRRLREATVAVAPYPPTELFYFSPLKVAEYMAAGLPVVTTAQGDLPWMLGGGGLLVEPGDDHAFLEAVLRLLEDRELRTSMGRQARERALSGFTWNQAADELEHWVASFSRRVAS